MMNKLLLTGSFFICLLIHGKVNGQDFATAKLPSFFNSYRSKTIGEKIYVHTDKEYYLAGETLWFKLYNVDGVEHSPISISKLAYVEILDAAKVPVLQAKIKLGEGSGHGSLQLPHTLPSGNYLFRAYTSWMKNFDADFYFEKNIAVLNTLSEEPVESAGRDSVDYDIQFFPEGGNLVSDLEAKLAFRVVDQGGKGVDFRGAILDDKGDTVLLFSPLFRGIGSFPFLPLKGSSYKAVLTMPGNRKIIKDLPRVYEAGYSLQVKNEAQRLLIKVQARTTEPNEVLHLFVHTRGGAPLLLQGSLQDNLLQFPIDKDSIREGITHITLFNNKMQPLCERLFFKPFKKKLAVSAIAGSKIYATRKKVTINIETKDEAAAGVSSDLSVSVFQKDGGNSAPAVNIESYLHLTSDLKGNIEDPAYYFSETGQNVTDAQDNLMLTQGWRRFVWPDIISPKPGPRYLPEIEGHIISGTIVNRLSGRPAPNQHTYLSVPGKKNQLYTSVSDSTGIINYYAKNFYGVKEIVLQPAASNSDVQINVATPFSEVYSSRTVPRFNPFVFNRNDLQQMSVNMQVQNVYYAFPLVETKTTDTLPFYGTAQKKYALDDYVRFPTMQEVLREYVTELNVYERNKNLRIAMIRRLPDGTAFKKDPLVLIDGVPLLGDQNKLFRYNPLDVKELHIINNDYFLGSAKTEGIVNFITYKGVPPSMELDPQATVVDYEGLQIEREFYQPVYETTAQRGNRMPDFRSLLLWNPAVGTNATGKSEISFYTSDVPGKYIVVVEGLGRNGKPGSASLEIEVVK